MGIAIRGGKQINCPGCQGLLMAVITEGVEVDMCDKCEGVWVDYIDDKSFLKLKAQPFTIDEIRRLRRLYEPLGKVEEVKYRKCPVCNDLMHRKNWGGYSGVIVDQCEQHGTWYEPGEAEKIREYVMLGGVEFEKLTYHDHNLSDLNTKLRKEIHRLDSRITAGKSKTAAIFTAITYK